jgi:transcriptional regulator with XRE-family HTH domain
MTEGEIIKEFRESAGFTDVDLAIKNGVPVRSVTKWENGKIKLSYFQMKKILKTMGLEVQLTIKKENEIIVI